MVPEGWQHTTFETHIDLLSGYPFQSDCYTESEDDVRLLRGDNIEHGGIRWRNAKRWPKREYQKLSKYHLSQGDFVVAMDRTWISSGLKVAEVRPFDLPCLLVQRVSRIRARKTLDQGLLRQYFSTHRFEQYVKAVQTETAVPHISAKQIRDFSVALPPISEQRKISKILATWDQAIDSTAQMIKNSKALKKALMQQLVTGKKRVPGFSDAWQECRFKRIFTRVDRKNAVGNTTVLTISGKDGLVSQKDYFSKIIASDNLNGYTLLYRGDFAYNKSYSNGYPYGAIKPLEYYEAGVVSSLYLCFYISEPAKHNHDFFRHYFEGGFFDREIYAIAQEGARNHGLLNVSAVDFFNTRLTIPTLAEQTAIATVINTAEAEVKNFEQQLVSLQLQKKALMQQLLTGKRRVKV